MTVEKMISTVLLKMIMVSIKNSDANKSCVMTMVMLLMLMVMMVIMLMLLMLTMVMRIALQSVDLLVKPWQYESNGLWLCNSNIATKSANVLCWNGRQIELTIEICIKQKLRFSKLRIWYFLFIYVRLRETNKKGASCKSWIAPPIVSCFLQPDATAGRPQNSPLSESLTQL